MVTETLRTLNWTGKHVLVACSGGVDSMVLLHGLLHLGLKPEVFHVNYRLRGAESDQDAELVRHACEQHGLELHLQTINGSLFKKKGLNLQNEARKVRRDFFASWTGKSADHIVVVSHHADDQEETFFLQYLRGAGVIGLGAIHRERNQVLRPFLSLRKSVLIEWAREHSVEWREDASNNTNAYVRNVLRNKILPELHLELPQLTESIGMLSACFRDEVRSIDQRLEPLLRKWQKSHELPVAEWIVLGTAEKEVLLNRIGISTGAVQEMDKLVRMKRGKQFVIGNRIFYRTRDAVAGQADDHGYELEVRRVDQLPASFSLDVAYFDAAKLSGELQLRSWQKNDVINPVGMMGSISVEKVLKDGGIARQERNSYLIVADNETVLWIPHLRISGCKLADQKTSEIIEAVLRSSTKSSRS